MTDATRAGRTLAVVSSLLVACEAEVSPQWWEGDFIRYATSRDLHACAGTPVVADQFVPFIAGELDIELPPRLDYEWLSSAEYAQRDLCSGPSTGCSSGTQAYALDPLLLHELVHGVTGASGMNRAPFFTEGLAVAYDPLTRFMESRYVAEFPDGLDDPRPELTRPAGMVSYQTAGGFVSFLLTRYGPEKVVEISRMSRGGDGLAVIRANFRVVFGAELDTEAELYMRSDSLGCDTHVFDVRPQDCTMPEVAWSGDQWVHAGIMDCEDDTVAGGVGATMWRSVTLEVPTAGRYLVRTFGEGGRVRLGRCFGCPWEHDDVLLYGSSLPEAVATLEAGTYFVRMEARADDAPLVGVAVSPVD